MSQLVKSLALIIQIVLIIFLSACSNPKPTQTDEDKSIFEQSGTIGETGGTIQVTDTENPLYGCSVEIPEGALTSQRIISIDTVKHSYYFEGDSTANFVSFEPSGTVFEKPVNITLSYKTETDINNLNVYYFDEEKLLWKMLPLVKRDAVNKTITAQTNHFTVFVVEDCNVRFDVTTFQYDAQKICAQVKLINPLYYMETDLLTFLETGAINIKELIIKQPFDVKAWFEVVLKEKRDFWTDPEIESKIISYGIYSYDGSSYEVRAKDGDGNVLLETNKKYLNIDQVEKYYSAEPILFQFNSQIDYGKEYYVEVLLYYVDSWNWILGSGGIWGTQGYFVSSYDDAKKFALMDHAPDKDKDGIIDMYDEITGEAPVVEITNPVSGSSFTQGENITFSGNSTDAEDGNLTGNSLVWTSDKDGQIGTGASFSYSDLSINNHIIKLTATDHDNNKTSKEISISITEKPTPSVPILISPANNSSGNSTITSLSWNASDRATSYSLQVSTDSSFSNFIYNDNVGNVTNKQINGLDNFTRYYWRVNAVNSYGSSDWSDIWNFYVGTEGLETGTVTDIDGNIYKTVKIGNQWWMAENLKVTHYRNGDAIPNVTDDFEWGGLSTGAYCAYKNDVNNVATYGQLYNWFTVNETRGLAPEGWDIPTDAEWRQMEKYLGMSGTEAIGWHGSPVGGKLKATGTIYWNSPNTGATNESGFTALPGGFRTGGTFYNNGSSALFWTATEGTWYREFSNSSSGVNRDAFPNNYGMSIRCIKGGSPAGKPSLQSPNNNQLGVSTSLQLQWLESDGSGAIKYTVQVSTSSTFNTIINNADNSVMEGDLHSMSIWGLDKNTKYYWRVKAENSYGTSEWSDVWNFTTIQGTPEPPTVSINQPTDGQHFTIGDNVTIKADASDTDGTVSKVKFYVNGTYQGEDTSAPYQYIWNTSGLSAGSYTLKATAVDNDNAETSSQITIMLDEPVNTAPTASFTVSPSSGGTSTTFNFDASGSSDNEDPVSALQVRWDWENDGIWDTNYSTSKTNAHQYSLEGGKTIKLEVKDTEGLIDTTENYIFIGETGTMTDQDGNVYQTIKIGNQWWMAENLKVTHYRNGDAIPNVTGGSEWVSLSTGAYCAYDNNNGNVSTYGLLYNRYAVDDSRGIAPEGWHVPSDEEWKELEIYLGMSQSEADAAGFRGTDEGGKLKETGTSHWWSPNTGATNESGFTALPGGYRSYDDGSFGALSVTGYWLSSTEYSSTDAWIHYITYYFSAVGRDYGDKRNGSSVRLVRD